MQGRKFSLLLSLTVLALFRFADVEGAFGIKIDSSVGSNEEEAADVNVNEQNESAAANDDANHVGDGTNENKEEANVEASVDASVDASVEASSDVVNETSGGVDSPNVGAESESQASNDSGDSDATTNVAASDTVASVASSASSASSAPDDSQSEDATDKASATEEQPIIQKGPFIDLFGDTLLSLEMVDETHAKLNTHYTNEALANKKVIGLYFSADWCGP